MIDAKKILDQFLGSNASGGLGGALSRMGGPGAPTRQEPATRGSDGGGFGDLLNQLGGGAKGGSGGALGGLGGIGGLAGGALAGGLASILMGKGKKSLPISGSAMKLGGLAILGGLAYKAWQNHQASQQAAGGGAAPAPQPLPRAEPVPVSPPPPESPFSPSSPAEEEQLGLLLVRAMIAAARADGHIDGEEIAKIREALKASGAGDDEQGFLLQYLGKPDDLDAIAAEARGPELASEVWLAARLTADPDTPAEQAFLKTFADKLGLGAPLVAHLEATAAQAKQSGVSAA
jgi:uncharacterized membrane protein YebE (DUF533 family)